MSRTEYQGPCEYLQPRAAIPVGMTGFEPAPLRHSPSVRCYPAQYVYLAFYTFTCPVPSSAGGRNPGNPADSGWVKGGWNVTPRGSGRRHQPTVGRLRRGLRGSARGAARQFGPYRLDAPARRSVPDLSVAGRTVALMVSVEVGRERCEAWCPVRPESRSGRVGQPA
jgi:hypothetical protein